MSSPRSSNARQERDMASTTVASSDSTPSANGTTHDERQLLALRAHVIGDDRQAQKVLLEELLERFWAWNSDDDHDDSHHPLKDICAAMIVLREKMELGVIGHAQLCVMLAAMNYAKQDSGRKYYTQAQSLLDQAEQADAKQGMPPSKRVANLRNTLEQLEDYYPKISTPSRDTTFQTTVQEQSLAAQAMTAEQLKQMDDGDSEAAVQSQPPEQNSFGQRKPTPSPAVLQKYAVETPWEAPLAVRGAKHSGA